MTGSERRRVTVPVRVRVTLAVVLVAAAGLVLAGSVTFLVLREGHLRDLDRRLVAAVGSARDVVTTTDDAEGAVSPLVTDTASAVRAIVAGTVPDRFQSSVGLVNGRAAFVPGVELPFRLDADPALVDRWVEETAGGEVVLGSAATSNRTLRYVAVPVEVQGIAGVGVYITAFDVGAELAEIGAGSRTFAIITAITLAAVAVAAWSVAARALQPIRRLRTAAEQISGSDLGVRIPVTGNDDVSDLTRTMNAMFDRLDRSASEQRRLLADIRHDLATPLTIMHGHLAVVDLHDPDDVRATHALVTDELERMGDLVSDLDALTGVDLARNRALLDVGELTRQVHAKASAISSEHTWLLGKTATVKIDADAGRVTQAWLQLADNAAKYAPAGTPVTIGSDVRGDVVLCWVADRGPGVPEHARDRIFERFARAEPGRGVSGSGLGLAIVAAIARAHGGGVELHSGPSGARFAIVLPSSSIAVRTTTGEER